MPQINMKLGYVGIVPKGVYDPSAAYKKLDLVYDARTSTSYLAIDEPGAALVTDTSKWMLIARSANIEIGRSFDAFDDLLAAYPTGDFKMHIAGGKLYTWDGSAWVSTGIDVSNKLDKLPINAAGTLPVIGADGTLQGSEIPARYVATSVLAETRGKSLIFNSVILGGGGGNG